MFWKILPRKKRESSPPPTSNTTRTSLCPRFLEVAGVFPSLSLTLISAVCVGEQSRWMLDGASMCKQQSDCHLIRGPLKSAAAMPEWDSACFSLFKDNCSFRPPLACDIHVNNPSSAKRSTPAALQLSNFTLVLPPLFVNYKSKSTWKVKHFLIVRLSFLWHVFSLKAPTEDTSSAWEYSRKKLSQKVNSKKVSVGNYYLFSISDQADFSTGDERALMSTRAQRFLHGPRQAISLFWQACNLPHTAK